jgi:hypothetical protein
MELTDPLWIDKWSKTHFTPRPLDFSAAIRKYAEGKDDCLFGSDEEPARPSGLRHSPRRWVRATGRV